MAIKNVDDSELGKILAEHLTPSHWIDSEKRLLGRELCMKQIARAFSSPGRNAFIFGDRGVGKTSLAVTAATVHNESKKDQFIYVPCGETTSFADVMQAVANASSAMAERLKKSKFSGGFSVGVEGIGNLAANYSAAPNNTGAKPQNIVDALEVIRLVGSKSKGRRIIVIDELDRLKQRDDKVLFSELIKNAATLPDDVRFIFCGIGRDIEEILGAHPSAGRYFEPIKLDRLHHNFLWDIIKPVAAKTGVVIEQETLVRIGIISDGFPHFVHLIGECIFWAMSDDPVEVTRCERRHYEAGIKGALEKTESGLRMAYQRATEKTKNKLEYEEALWALADKAETRRQMSDIYDRSYKRIMQQRKSKPLEQEVLNQRLLTLRGDNHGNIVIGHGAGWYSFSENVLRGYVRLKAESEGVELTPDPA
jgi:uncharacterized protein